MTSGQRSNAHKRCQRGNSHGATRLALSDAINKLKMTKRRGPSSLTWAAHASDDNDSRYGHPHEQCRLSSGIFTRFRCACPARAAILKPRNSLILQSSWTAMHKETQLRTHEHKQVSRLQSSCSDPFPERKALHACRMTPKRAWDTPRKR